MCDDCGNNDGSVDLHLMCQACKDINLFELPPPNEDCLICFLPLPTLETGSKYQSCCGKIICSGCIHAIEMMDDDDKCPFCRVPTPEPESDEEIIEMIKKRVEMDDANAIYNLGCDYDEGLCGLPQDRDKAFELFLRAAKLGSDESYKNIGNAYYLGRGVERDDEKAQHYWELAAIGGNLLARYNLGVLEEREGNMSNALKHYMIAVGCGYDKSLKKIRKFYMNGHATKDDYAKALRAHQKYIDGIKSAERDEAAAFDSDEYRYY